MHKKSQKEIVWIIGNSASGKESFIHHVTYNSDSPVGIQLGWENKKLQVCTSSIKNIAQFYGDPITKNREQIPEEVSSLLKSADVILLKWQEVDAKANLPSFLYQLFPEVRHRIVRLSVNRGVLIERLKQKPWWGESDDANNFVNDEIDYVESVLAKLATKFEILKINANSREYSIIK